MTKPLHLLFLAAAYAMVLLLVSPLAASQVSPERTIPQLQQQLRGGTTDDRAQTAADLVDRLSDPAAAAVLATALTDPDVDIRELTCSALSFAGAVSVPLLRQVLHGEGVGRREAIDCLGTLGPAAADAAPDLLALLSNAMSDREQSALEIALAQIGDAAFTGLESKLALGDPTREAAMVALAMMAKDAPQLKNRDRLLNLLEDEVKLPCDSVCGSAIQGLGDMGSFAAPAAPRLLAVMDPPIGPYWPWAAYTLGRIGADADQAVPVLRKLLRNRDDFGRAMIPLALGKFGSQAAAAVPDLEALLMRPDKDVRANAATALGQIGAPASPAVGSLGAILSDPVPDVRRHAADALDRIADALPMEIAAHADADVRVLLGQFRSALETARREGDLDEYPNEHGETVTTLNRAVGYLQDVLSARRVARRGTYALLAAAIATMIAAGAIAVLTARIRWLVLTLLGRRWRFVVGSCAAIAEISGDRILVRSVHDATATVARFDVAGWPLDKDRIDDVRSAIPEASNLLVVADDASFRKPWAHTLGTPWSEGKSAIVAGQVCIMPPVRASRRTRERSLRFRGMMCRTAPGREHLGAVADEIATASKAFRAWGAAVDQIQNDAQISDLGEALCVADVVHVAAHATGAGIDLVDGVFGADFFMADVAPRLRCRLLVLSACEAGRIDDDHSLVYQLVRAGVNVVASLSLVRDFACWALFEEFYRALLPTKSPQGVEIAEAVRIAGFECARRFGNLETVLRPRGPHGGWKTGIDGFILYGDPSVRLTLVSPDKR